MKIQKKIQKKHEILSYKIPTNKVIVIKKGFFFGAKLEVLWKENLQPLFYSFGGLLTYGGFVDDRGHTSSNFQSANIYQVETTRAMLWIHLKNQKINIIPERF